MVPVHSDVPGEPSVEQPDLAPSLVSELGMGPTLAARPTAVLLAQGGRGDITLVEKHISAVAGAWKEA